MRIRRRPGRRRGPTASTAVQARPVAQQISAGERSDQHAHEVSGEHRGGHRQGQGARIASSPDREQCHGQQHCDGRERGGQRRQRLPRSCPRERPPLRAAPAMQAPVYRLEDDDRDVDERPHRQHETAEGERVQRLPRRVEDDEDDRERDGNGEGGDEDRRADSAETAGSPARSGQRLDDLLLETVVARANERRLVEDRFDFHARRQVLQRRDGLLDCRDDVQGVAARNAQNVEVDGVLAVDRDRLRLR